MNLYSCTDLVKTKILKFLIGIFDFMKFLCMRNISQSESKSAKNEQVKHISYYQNLSSPMKCLKIALMFLKKVGFNDWQVPCLQSTPLSTICNCIQPVLGGEINKLFKL